MQRHRLSSNKSDRKPERRGIRIAHTQNQEIRESLQYLNQDQTNNQTTRDRRLSNLIAVFRHLRKAARSKALVCSWVRHFGHTRHGNVELIINGLIATLESRRCFSLQFSITRLDWVTAWVRVSAKQPNRSSQRIRTDPDVSSGSEAMPCWESKHPGPWLSLGSRILECRAVAP